ncbi:MAG: hypothetical protein ILO36_01000 [Abditibacteriota bacterium]|nr:hypothetical protein [Abditibacteriota bacterium]
MKLFVVFLTLFLVLPAFGAARRMKQHYPASGFAICEYIPEADTSGNAGARGSRTRIGGFEDNGRCVATVPLEGRWKTPVLSVRKPNLFDLHTGTGEVYLLAGEISGRHML